MITTAIGRRNCDKTLYNCVIMSNEWLCGFFMYTNMCLFAMSFHYAVFGWSVCPLEKPGAGSHCRQHCRRQHHRASSSCRRPVQSRDDLWLVGAGVRSRLFSWCPLSHTFKGYSEVQFNFGLDVVVLSLCCCRLPWLLRAMRVVWKS